MALMLTLPFEASKAALFSLSDDIFTLSRFKVISLLLLADAIIICQLLSVPSIVYSPAAVIVSVVPSTVTFSIPAAFIESPVRCIIPSPVMLET